jgi:hypothetical protein
MIQIDVSKKVIENKETILRVRENTRTKKIDKDESKQIVSRPG